MLGAGEFIAELAGLSHGFGGFAGGEDVGGDLVSGCGHGGGDIFEVVGGDVGIGDDGGAAFETGGFDSFAGFGDDAGGEEDVVGAVAEIDVDLVHE